MKKLSLFIIIFLILCGVGISANAGAATGYVSVSSVAVSKNPVILGEKFSVSFSLKETKGQSKTFEKVNVAILKPDGSLGFDFATWSNVRISARSSWSKTASNTIFTTQPSGTYTVVIRAKLNNKWFDLDNVSSKVDHPKKFKVVTNFGRVKGTLHVDSVNGAKLSGASVTCGGKTTTTKSDGTYSINDIQTGNQSLSFSKTGFQSYSKTVSVVGGKTVDVGDNYLIQNKKTQSDDYGNTVDTAKSVEINKTISGKIDYAGDWDVFKIGVGSPTGVLTVYTTGSTDTVGKLKNSSGSDINGASNNDYKGDRNFRFSASVTTGTYYIAVWHNRSTGTGAYKLSLEFAVAGKTLNPYPLSSSLTISEKEAASVIGDNTLGSTKYYGTSHLGQDIGAYVNSLVYSLGDGVVTINKTKRNDRTAHEKYWNSVLIIWYPSAKIYVYYGHISSDLVDGASVSKKQVIGKIKPSYDKYDKRTPGNDHLHLGVCTKLILVGWGYATGIYSEDTLKSQGWRNPLDLIHGQLGL